jgi:IS5 family transposase
LVTSDLRHRAGRHGLPSEAVLRCALSQTVPPVELEELAFHLEDSASFLAFARLPWGWSPKKSVLHKTISAIRADTWEAVNKMLPASARQEGLESGNVVRVDSTIPGTITAARLRSGLG